jgi:DNA helicase-2/ATP-dependent DNA helicase PcrA
LEETSTAINEEVKECSFVPVITTYDIRNIDELLAHFRNLCSDFDIEMTAEKVAVLYRSKNLFNAITGIAEISSSNLPWTPDDPYAEDFAKGKYLFSNGEFRKGFRLIQNAIIKALSGSHYCSVKDLDRVIELNGFAEFRKKVYGLLKILPDTECSIGEWIDRANAIFRKNEGGIELKIKNGQREFQFDELFGAENKRLSETDYRIGTIHSIKGETFEAVLVVLKQKGIGRYYKTLLREDMPISENEELRIVYVGITRPRRLLLLAVPDEENKAAWAARLFGQ